MPTSAPGSRPAPSAAPLSHRIARPCAVLLRPWTRVRRQGGFTLLELLVVVAVIALASSIVALALPDPRAARLEREAMRLSMLLEGARAQSRALGVAVDWVPAPSSLGPSRQPDGARPTDFLFIGLPPAADLPTQWQDRGDASDPTDRPQVELHPLRAAVRLGPEPVIPAQRIVLRLGDRQLTLATDGLAPFGIQSDGDANR